MRNFILFLLVLNFIFIQKNTTAQTYYPLLEDSTTWDTYSFVWSLPGCAVTGTDRAFINGDTLINSVLYKKISAYTGINITPMPCPVWAYDNTSYLNVALLREDTALRKVWRYNENIGTEFLLYDFGVLQGDTFITSFGWDTALGPDTFVVDSTGSSLMLDGSFRKIIYMTFADFGGVTLHEAMIEGIGGSAGFYMPPMNYGLGFATLPGCVIKAGIPLYHGGAPSSGFTFTICPSLIGNTNRIKGNAYVDLNSNSVYDGSDAPLSYKVITQTGSSMFDFTDVNGNYDVYVTDTGNFSVTGQVLNNFSSVPLVNTSYFPVFSSVDSLNDFAYQPLSVFNDLEIYLFYMYSFRSGYNGTYKIRVKNTGTTSISPLIVLHPDSYLQYVSSTQTPLGVTTDSIYWNLSPLAPFQQLEFNIVLAVDSGLLPGTPISSFVEAFPVAGDITPSNNYYSVLHNIVNSFDPNDISVDRDTIFSTELLNPPFLNYVIRFQNTGNDTAFVIRIENPVPVYLDLTTLEFIGSSHPLTIHWNHYLNQLEFDFENILLPDSNVNEPESHGYILYRIKPKTNLSINNYILNRASIYFDSNPPVVTNYAQTIIASPTGIQDLPVNIRNVVVYPNPFNEILTIKYAKGVRLISVMDLSGRIILEIPVDKFSEEELLNASQLTKGIYLLRLTGETSMVVKKIIKL